MTEPNPLLASVNDERSWYTGIGPIEGLDTIISGIDDGSWLEIGLGAAGVALEAVSFWWDPVGALLRWAASWVMEHLEPARQFLDQLAGNPPVIEAYAATWGNVAKLMAETADEIETAVTEDLESWKGDAADTYRAQITEKITGLREAAALCAGSGRWTSVIGALVGTVRAIVREALAALVAWLVKSIGLTVLCGPFGVSEACRTAVLEIARVTNMITDTIGKLMRSLGNLQAKLPDALGAFEQVVAKLAPRGATAVSSVRPVAAVKRAPVAHLVDEANAVRPASFVDDGARLAEPPALRVSGDGGGTVSAQSADALLSRPFGARAPTTPRPTTGAGTTSGGVPVIHAGAVSARKAKTFLKDNYPELAKINKRAWSKEFVNVAEDGTVQAPGNCVRAAQRTDEYLATGTVAPAEIPTKTESLRELLKWVDPKASAVTTFERMQTFHTWDDLTAQVSTMDIGTRGVVAIDRGADGGGIGHIINVVRDHNGVVYLDGWEGGLAVLEELKEPLMFLAVHRP